MSFVSDLALSFIAFDVGKFFKKEVLMRTGRRIIIITISEAIEEGRVRRGDLLLLMGTAAGLTVNFMLLRF